MKTGQCLCGSVVSQPLFSSGLQLIGWGPLTLWSAIRFTQSSNLNVHFIQKYPHKNTQIMFDQISAHSITQSSWYINITITLATTVPICFIWWPYHTFMQLKNMHIYFLPPMFIFKFKKVVYFTNIVDMQYHIGIKCMT